MRFGIAAADISPPFSTTMAGYGARQDHFDDIHDPLVFTALVLEEGDRRVVIGSADLITFENEHVTSLRETIAEVAGAPVDNVMLNASHTHGGPELRDWAAYFHKNRDVAPAARYREWLEGQVLAAVEQAVGGMQPGSLWLGMGRTRLPMSRRAERNGGIVNAPNPGGVVDDRLQVLVLRDESEVIRAIGLRVSCHPVATGAQHRITADYPGAFRASCRRAFGPNVTPFFLQGAGGDMRPASVADGKRWRIMDHEELAGVGDELLAETLRVLTATSLTRLDPLLLEGRLQIATVPCERTYTTREQFEKLAAEGSGWEPQYAAEALRLIEAKGAAPSEVPIRVHALWLNEDFAVVGLQGEVLVGLGSYVEESMAPKRTLLLGYTNGCVSYLPDSAELARGGYEQTSYLYHGWTGPFAPGIEKTIAAAVWRRGGPQA